ncbi:MAG: UPF0182 family protein [Acidobacteria bacterium]|nr:UPF0182 family protein [Acidobacteriota bacterium]
MRLPGDMPRRRREAISSRGRIGILLLLVALFVLLTSLRGIAGFYTDLLWFDSLGHRGVFTGVLGAKATLAAIFTLLFFGLLWLNLFIADRLGPRFRPAGPEEDVIERYQQLIGHRTGLVRIIVAALFALIAGVGTSGQWRNWLMFTHAQSFGQKDPLFHTDAGFYVFRLPFLRFLVDWGFASTVMIVIVVAAAHYLNGGIRVQGAGQRVTPQVKAHLSVLLGVLALLKAFGYWLQRYNLVFSHRGTVDGATYTDVKAQLPAINLLILISVAAVALLIVNIWRRGWVLPLLAVGLWSFVAVVVGAIYPAFIQRVKVQPSESTKEAPYIKRNIAATRLALNLPRNSSSSVQFNVNDKLTATDLGNNGDIVRNIRLWDPDKMRDAYQRLQESQSYYAITDVDVDRYDINGQKTEVEVGVRELNSAGAPQSSWEARHLAYTHGQAVVMAPANAKDQDGRPNLVISGVPVNSSVPGVTIEQPDVYVGEGQSGYVVTNTNRAEIDYQSGGKTVTTHYRGKDGVGIGSYLKRAAFALRFGDINPLISSQIRKDSKILYVRDVRDRVQTLAPFLSFDKDAYSVVVGGRIKFIIDGYTTTNRYPYAQGADRSQLDSDSGLDHPFNYVRNSVKAVVDAYDGTTTFYVVDNTDPLVRAYRAVFPKLFTDGSKAPAALRDHFRYPEELFRVQTAMWGRYHLDSPDDFYNQTGAWTVALDPDTEGGAQSVLSANGTPIVAQAKRIEPYYLLMKIPGQKELSFLLLRPFVPVSENDTRQELTAFMVANSDPEHYGQLQTFVMPTDKRPDGPALVGASMRQDQVVSQTETLLGSNGSAATYGNLIVVPINGALLYVRPFYVEAQTTKIPEVRKVIASFEGAVAIDDTLQGALTKLFGGAPPTQEEGGTTTPAPTDQTVDQLLAQAAAAFSDADKALRSGDLATYQKKVNEGRDLVQQARTQSSRSKASTPTTTQPAAA